MYAGDNVPVFQLMLSYSSITEQNNCPASVRDPVSLGGRSRYLQEDSERWGVHPPQPVDSFDPGAIYVGNQTTSSGVGLGQFSEYVADEGAKLQLYRFYSTKNTDSSSPLGVGWTHNYNTSLINSGTAVTIKQGAGVSSTFLIYQSAFVPQSDFTTLQRLGDGSYQWTLVHGTVYNFDATGQLMSIVDRNGNTLTLTRDSLGQLTNVTASTGQQISFTYNIYRQLVRTIDPLQTNTYTYFADGQLASVTDGSGTINYQYYEGWQLLAYRGNRLGNSMLYNYDGNGRPSEETDALGEVTRYQWIGSNTAVMFLPNGQSPMCQFDANQLLVGVSDAAGNISLVRNGQGLVTAYTDRLGNVSQYRYDNRGNLTMAIDSLGRTNRWVYGYALVMPAIGLEGQTNLVSSYTDSAYNLPVQISDASGNSTFYQRDSHGNVSNRVDALGHSTQAAYDSRGNLIQLRDANGHAWQYAYNNLNLVTNSIDPLGGVNQVVYDAAGRPVQSIDALGRTSTSKWDGKNRLIQTIDAAGATTGYLLDLNGNVIAQTNALGQVSTYTYDAMNRLLTTTLPGSSTPFTTKTYDPMGTLTSTTDALGHRWSFGLNALEQVVSKTDPLGQAWILNRDALGRVTGTVDPNGHTNTSVYDAVGQLIASTNALGQATTFVYDPVGKLAQVTDARGNGLSFSYDALHRRTQTSYATNDVEQFTYDMVGNLTNHINRAGQSIALTYDGANRLTQKSYVGTDGVINYGYDAVNQLTSVLWTVGTATNSALSMVYDAAGRLTQEVQSVTTASAKSVGYQYYADGKRQQLTYPDGSFITYEYDANGWLTAIKDGGTNTIVSYTYDAAGRRTQRVLGNATFTVYNYDNANQLTSIQHQQITGDTTGLNGISQYQYGYDAAGNRTYMKRASGLGDVYTYDAANQLTEVKYNASNPDTTPSDWSHDVSYTYDAAGNRTNVSDNGSSVDYSANNLNEYTTVGGTNYSYDANGNLTGDGVWSYTYDSENRLVQASNGTNTIAYTYDPSGRLTERRSSGSTVSTNRMYYAGWQMIADYDGADNLRRKYVYGVEIDEPVRMTGNGTNYYYHADALGSITEITDSTGNLVEQYRYDVYGTPTILAPDTSVRTSSAIGNRRFFTGRNRDAATGLYNLRNRCYSPTLGRFMQLDPSGLGGKDLNMYRYCGNNPVNAVDPMGLSRDVLNRAGQFFKGVGAFALGLAGFLSCVDSAGLLTPFIAGAATASCGYGIVNIESAFRAPNEVEANAMLDAPSNPAAIIGRLVDGSQGQFVGDALWLAGSGIGAMNGLQNGKVLDFIEYNIEASDWLLQNNYGQSPSSDQASSQKSCP